MNDVSGTWRAVPGFEGRYEAASYGRVRSLLSGAPRNLRPTPNAGSYLIVTLYLNGKPHRRQVHRVVALTFIGPCPDGQEVRHLDGNRQNNVISNLTYGTRAENMQDSLRHGTNRNANKTHCPQGHPFDGDNLVVGPRGGRKCRTCIREQSRDLRGWQGGPPNALKTHCKNGHEFTPENSYARPDGLGKRSCRTCKRENDLKYKARVQGH